MLQGLVIVLGIGLIIVGLVFAVKELATAGAGGQGRGLSLQGPAWLIVVAFGIGLVIFASVWDFKSDEVRGIVIGQPTATPMRTTAPVPTPTAVVPTPTAVVPTPTEVVPTPTALVPTPTVAVPTPTVVVPTPTSTPPPIPGEGFVGTWNTDSTGRLVVALNPAGDLDVHVFGSCTPSACDNGVQRGEVVTDSLARMAYTSSIGHASYRVDLVLIQDGQLQTTTITTFKPGDRRGVNCTGQLYRQAPASGDRFVRDNDCDGVPTEIDNCPGAFENADNSDTANPDQRDQDGDRIGDICDT